MPGMPAGFASGPPPGGSISPSQLASQAAYTVLGNPTAAPASPVATTNPVVSGSATAARFLGSANNTAAAPTLLLEPSGNSGWRWDGTLGDVASVDAIDRLMMRVVGSTEISSGVAAGTAPVLILRSTAGPSSVLVTAASPEGTFTATVGAIALDVVAGRLYLKRTGSGNTGWVQIDRCESGTYTPTGTIVTNLDSVTPGTFWYQRVGDVVAVWGRVTFDPTAASSVTFGLSLPIASALTVSTELVGVCGSWIGFISGDATNDRADCQISSNVTTSTVVNIAFSYRVL